MNRAEVRSVPGNEMGQLSQLWRLHASQGSQWICRCTSYQRDEFSAFSSICLEPSLSTKLIGVRWVQLLPRMPSWFSRSLHFSFLQDCSHQCWPSGHLMEMGLVRFIRIGKWQNLGRLVRTSLFPSVKIRHLIGANLRWYGCIGNPDPQLTGWPFKFVVQLSPFNPSPFALLLPPSTPI